MIIVSSLIFAVFFYFEDLVILRFWFMFFFCLCCFFLLMGKGRVWRSDCDGCGFLGLGIGFVLRFHCWEQFWLMEAVLDVVLQACRARSYFPKLEVLRCSNFARNSRDTLILGQLEVVIFELLEWGYFHWYQENFITNWCRVTILFLFQFTNMKFSRLFLDLITWRPLSSTFQGRARSSRAIISGSKLE